ncbi:uncharacterized protein LOC141826980 [Curcuma longa]|uniref:uncharacterized protein LOC141826980 n=1 Tax=Curcuma longa TaxID=136217 RepID=UPI003D9F17AB
MGDQNGKLNDFIKLHHMHQLASAQVVCLVAAWYARNRQKQNNEIPCLVLLEGEHVQASASKANNQCVWNKVMDDALIDAYLNQHNIGNRVGGTFTTCAFENIVNELKVKFPDKLIDKDRVQNRMKHIKRGWISCYDIFKNGMSGFAWDPITEFFSAEPEVWQQLIEIKPTAALWKSKPIRNYEKLVQLYGKDRATGQHANTASEMRKRRASMEVENNIDENHFETIDEVEFLISQPEIHLDNSNTVNEDVQIPTSSSESTKSQTNSFVGASSKNKSAKKGKIDDDGISNAIDHVGQAIMSSTHEMVKSNELPISENEVWSLLTQLGVEQHIISACYLYLVQRPKMLRALLGCPFKYRKNLLFQMMDKENLPHD